MVAVARITKAQEDQLRKRFPGLNPATLTDSQLQRVMQFASLSLQDQQKINQLAQAKLPAVNDNPYLALITRTEAAEPNLNVRTVVLESGRPAPAVEPPLMPMVPAIRECEGNIESGRLPGGVMAATAITAEPALVEASAREQMVEHVKVMTSSVEQRLKAALQTPHMSPEVAQNLVSELAVLGERRKLLADPGRVQGVDDAQLLSMERNLAVLSVALDKPSVTHLHMERNKDNGNLVDVSATMLATQEMMDREQERLRQQHPHAKVSFKPYDYAQDDAEYKRFELEILGANPANITNAEAIEGSSDAILNPLMQDAIDAWNKQKLTKELAEQSSSFGPRGP